jgi:hypothetical protein
MVYGIPQRDERRSVTVIEIWKVIFRDIIEGVESLKFCLEGALHVMDRFLSIHVEKACEPHLSLAI